MIIALGARGVIERALIDYPPHFKAHGFLGETLPTPTRSRPLTMKIASVTGSATRVVTAPMFWKDLLPQQKLGPDAEHMVREELADLGAGHAIAVEHLPPTAASRVAACSGDGRGPREAASPVAAPHRAFETQLATSGLGMAVCARS